MLSCIKAIELPIPIPLPINEHKFVCDENSYLFTSDQSADHTEFYSIDLSNATIGSSERFGTSHINATGYNVKDDYIYGFEYGNDNSEDPDNSYHVVRIDSELNIERFNITGLSKTRFYLGDISMDGIYYLANRDEPNLNNALQEIQRVNLSTKTLLPKITLKYGENITPILTADFAFNPKDNKIYMLNSNNNQLIRIDPESSQVEELGYVGNIGDTYSVINFFDVEGNFYFYINNYEKIYKIDISDPSSITSTATEFKDISGIINSGDGARCANASITQADIEIELDFGDLPESYPTLLKDNGARHAYPEEEEPIIYLGAGIDSEKDGTLSENSTDDLFDDGVSINNITLSEATIKAGETITLEIKTAGHAYLNGWIDWNGDGDFNDTDEQIAKNLTEVNGSIQITLNVPNSENNISTYARFRYSSDQDLLPVGVAHDGEVEDYHININPKIKKLRGVFNIERTDSGNYAINSEERNAWYTQIVGRDFDYSVLFYTEDMSSEKEIDNVTVKLEIVDQDHNDSVLYQRYAHIKNDPPKSRISVTFPVDDLATVPATQKAIFRISYGVDAEGAILQADCETDPKICYDTNLLIRTDYAFDNFAIRPETFYVTLADGSQERINSRTPTHSIDLASGYEYNLSVIATEYGSIVASKGYNKNFNASFEFNTTGLTACANTSPILESINFDNGLHNNVNFNHNNVGLYTLSIEEDENWTNIDHLNGDCILGDSATSANGNSKSGCNIKLQTDSIALNFFPDHFNVDLNLSNLPNSGHPDFIYMSELNSTYQRVAIGFQGEITAQNEENTSTTNFTAGCVATPITLDLNSTTISVEGIDKIIHTVAGTEVAFSRLIRYNDDPDISHLDYNGTLSHIKRELTITTDKFLDENNGTLSLDMRYNLNKNIQEPINPVQIKFHAIEVSAQEANSSSHDKINIVDVPHTPSGGQNFINNVKNFYFAQVAPDLINYPMVNMHVSPIVHTPLNIDIFCSASNTYCRDTNVTLHSNWNSSERKQSHFYLSVHHNPNLDGNVTELNPSTPNVTIIPDPTPLGVDDITLASGRNGIITTRFDNCNSPSCIVTIVSNPAITFTPKSHYQVNCTNIDPSSWTGAGKRGNAIESQPQLSSSGKMEW